jgi:hypothetical protein
VEGWVIVTGPLFFDLKSRKSPASEARLPRCRQFRELEISGNIVASITEFLERLSRRRFFDRSYVTDLPRRFKTSQAIRVEENLGNLYATCDSH